MSKNTFSARRSYRHYPESIKLQVVREYLSTDCSKSYLVRKYGLKSHKNVDLWLKKYGEKTNLRITEHLIKLQQMAKEPEDVQELKRRIVELEKELEDSRLLADAYSRMITIAEDELNIPIRKKSNTKQSDK